MCASFLQHLSGRELQALQETFTGKKEPVREPHAGIRRPTEEALVLFREGFDTASFGVDYGIKRQINGRIESIVERPYYSSGDWVRGVLPVSSFIEYDRAKHPIDMRMKENRTFLATLHRESQFIIITRIATLQTKNIHPRLPYLLREEQINEYLFEKLSFIDILTLVNDHEPILELRGQINLF